MIKKIIFIFMLIITSFSCLSCQKKGLYLNNNKETISLGNEKTRIVFNKNTGSIIEITNQEKNLSFKLDKDSDPIRLKTLFKSANDTTPLYSRYKVLKPTDNSFNYQVNNQTKDNITLEFNFSFSNNVSAICYISLDKDSDEIIFKSKLDNLDHKTIEVVYPIISGINELSNGGVDDYLLSSYATGYLINNPIHSLIDNNVSLSGEDATLYPSGFGQTMQFMSYFVKDIGGLYIQTKDESETSIKDFIVSEVNNTLELSIGHYVDDLAYNSVDFDYETIIKNLNIGSWYEAANIYKTWAICQSWCNNGKNIDNQNLNKALYEDSILCNFVLPTKASQSTYGNKIYNTIKSNILDGTILNIGYYDTINHHHIVGADYVEQYNTNANTTLIKNIESNKDLFAYFYYSDVVAENYLDKEPDYVKEARMLNYQGYPESITFGSPFDFICMSSSAWQEEILNRQETQITKLHASGDYVDIGISALHPVLCFDSSHSHGTRINVLKEQYELLEKTANNVRSKKDSNGNYCFTGQELITEQIIPYVDLYQARASSNNMGGMEHDLLMPLIKNNLATKIPLFEYIYSEYAGKRTDGFVLPTTTMGNGYYGSVASVLFNGGIPQYNYEWLSEANRNNLSNNLDIDMIKFVYNLGLLKLNVGSNYLNYGTMCECPNFNIKTNSYPFENWLCSTFLSLDLKETGNVYYQQVINQTWKFNNNIGIFLCNIDNNSVNINSNINTFKLYKISNGSVYLTDYLGNSECIGTIQNGNISININLQPKTGYLLELKTN